MECSSHSGEKRKNEVNGKSSLPLLPEKKNYFIARLWLLQKRKVLLLPATGLTRRKAKITRQSRMRLVRVPHLTIQM